MKSKATLLFAAVIGMTVAQGAHASACTTMASAMGKVFDKATLQHNIGFYREMLTNIEDVLNDSKFSDQQKRNYAAYQLDDLQRRIDRQFTKVGSQVISLGCDVNSAIRDAREATRRDDTQALRSLIKEGVAELDEAASAI